VVGLAHLYATRGKVGGGPPRSNQRSVEFTLHDARPVLLNLGESGEVDITPWADRVRR
jgi:hypothetical protein